MPNASAKPTLGVWGLAPKKKKNLSNSLLLFPEKEAKSVSSASQKTFGDPKGGEGDRCGRRLCGLGTVGKT
jgi:hypothetical protein